MSDWIIFIAARMTADNAVYFTPAGVNRVLSFLEGLSERVCVWEHN